MASELARLEMTAVTTPAQWLQVHELRRAAFFDGRDCVYDEAHPDDYAPDHHPFLLLADGVGVATVRVDLFTAPQAATFRLLAVMPATQRRGYGSILMRQAEQFARQNGCDRFVAYVAPTSIGFWEKLGYRVAADQTGATDPRMEKAA